MQMHAGVPCLVLSAGCCSSLFRRTYSGLTALHAPSLNPHCCTGAATGEVDLLPVPSPMANWTARLSVHYSQDSSLIYWFNGSQATQVPMGSGASTLEGLSDHFTLSLWMKHGVTPSKGKREEETVICSTMRSGKASLPRP